MLSRRKMFRWVAGVAGTVAAVPALASTRLREMADAKMFAEFPGFLMSRAPDPPLDTASAEFVRLQQHFREHPELLWASPHHSKMQELVMRAQHLAQPFMEARARPDISFSLDAWHDTVTDNVLLKGYIRFNMDKAVGQRGPEAGAGYCLRSHKVRDKSVEELEGDINEIWSALTTALFERPADWIKIEGGATRFGTLDELSAAKRA